MAEMKDEKAMEETTGQTAEETVQTEEADAVKEADAAEADETAEEVSGEEDSQETEEDGEASQKKGFFGKRKTGKIFPPGMQRVSFILQLSYSFKPISCLI